MPIPREFDFIEYEAFPAAMAMIDAAMEVLEGSGHTEIDEMRDRLNEERNTINDWRLSYLSGKSFVSDVIGTD